MRVATIGLTPVKGMAHLPRSEVDLLIGGPREDRAFCLVEAGGTHILRSVDQARLMACRAEWRAPTLTIHTPGRTVTGEVVDGPKVRAEYWGRDVDLVRVEGPWNALMSEYVGRDVELCRVVHPGSIVWAGSVSILTTSSLAEIARRTGREREDGHRFRATMVIDTGDAPAFVEDEWVGARLRIGAATVRMAGLLPRCAVVNRRPDSGDADVEVLKALSPDRGYDQGIWFGLEGGVELPGTVRVGDPATVLPAS